MCEALPPTLKARHTQLVDVCSQHGAGTIPLQRSAKYISRSVHGFICICTCLQPNLGHRQYTSSTRSQNAYCVCVCVFVFMPCYAYVCCCMHSGSRRDCFELLSGKSFFKGVIGICVKYISSISPACRCWLATQCRRHTVTKVGGV